MPIDADRYIDITTGVVPDSGTGTSEGGAAGVLARALLIDGQPVLIDGLAIVFE